MSSIYLADELNRLKARIAELEAQLQAERDEWTIEGATGQQQINDLASQIAELPAQTPKVRKPRNNPLALANADCGALLPGGDLARLDPEHKECLA